MFSILHLTDLHRSSTDPLTNAELVSALVADRDRYVRETPPVPAPDAIVVSGDLIQGVALGSPGHEQELAAQYETAYALIAELTDRFLGGDRSRVVIVPGNHDVDWNAAFGSMRLVADEEIPKGMPGALHEPGTPFRWDWRERRLYRIEDEAAYARRLGAFWAAFERFYAGVDGLLSVRPGADANLYSLDEGRIAVAAFNSCAGNDCFSFSGEIPREAVGRAAIDLKDAGPWRLRVAVWHHDVEGPPSRADYMDVDVVRGMIGRGFRLGLYGHQHRPQVTPQRARLLDDETMAIASAGSLCAGRWDLPTGDVRGYSVVEISDDYAGARVHVREMGFANLFSPARLREFAGRSFVDLDWTVPLDAGGRPEDAVARERAGVVDQAESALRLGGDPAAAFDLLSRLGDGADPYVRALLVEAARRMEEPGILARVLEPPRNIDELVSLVDALSSTGRPDDALAALAAHGGALGLPAPMRSDLERRVALARWKK